MVIFYNHFLMQQSTILKQPQSIFNAIVVCIDQFMNSPHQEVICTSPFNLLSAPTLPIKDYLSRIFKLMGCSLSVFICSLILIDRIQQLNPGFTINKKNIHRLVITSHAIAAKSLDDFYYKNTYYAKIGGITPKMLNSLEIEFMRMINFNAFITETEFHSYLERLEFFGEIQQQQEELRKPKEQQKGKENGHMEMQEATTMENQAKKERNKNPHGQLPCFNVKF